MLQQLIDQLGKDIGIEVPTAPEEDGAYVLLFEPDQRVQLYENDDQSIYISTPLAPLPKESQEEYLLSAMSGNLFGAETGGAVLGIDRTGEFVTLNGFLSKSAHYREFRDLLEDFTNYADAWRQETLAFASLSHEE